MERIQEHVTHSFPPLFDGDSRVLILGSMPSPKSREQGFYYGHPQNRFWKVMAAVLGEEIPVTVEEKKAMMHRHSIALWDSLEECDIRGASDSSIQNPVPADIPSVLKKTKIRAIFTTGAAAYKYYTEYNYPLTGIPAVRLPSTSPANCAVSFEALVKAYGAVADALKDGLQADFVYPSPLGDLYLFADEKGLTALYLQEPEPPVRGAGRGKAQILTGQDDLAKGRGAAYALQQAKAWLDQYFAGREPDVCVPLHLTGTDFQTEVWKELLAIPYGKTVTYGDIAEKLARRRLSGNMAPQAVGQAIGRNPVSLIVPCHRVLGRGGALTGYGGGLENKTALLQLEGSFFKR